MAEEVTNDDVSEQEISQVPAMVAPEEDENTPAQAQPVKEEDVSPEEEAKLPFPTAAVVRIMKANMDREKMVRKEVKVEMNKWLGKLCAKVSKQMNCFPYVMMGLNEFKEGKRVFEDLEGYEKDKKRVLAHLEAIKKAIERLQRDLGKEEEDEVIVVKKRVEGV